MKEGIRAEVLRAEVPPEQREAWYERHLRNGMVAVYETGYSIYTLRQASRRSWRIGQKHDYASHSSRTQKRLRKAVSG